MHPEILSISLFWFVTAYTPGPNNVVASYSGFNFGIKKTIPHILGVTLGFTSLVLFLSIGLINVFKLFPIIQIVIRYLGTLFLIYLAYKIAFSSNTNQTKVKQPIGFFETFFFQFINPKGVVVAMITVSTFVDVQFNYLRDSIIVTTVYFFMAIGSITTWCLIGKYLRKFATSKKFITNFNYTMSFLLIVCVILFYV